MIEYDGNVERLFYDSTLEVFILIFANEVQLLDSAGKILDEYKLSGSNLGFEYNEEKHEFSIPFEGKRPELHSSRCRR